MMDAERAEREMVKARREALQNRETLLKRDRRATTIGEN